MTHADERRALSPLPSYMDRIRAHLLAERGMGEAKATATAIATAYKFCRTGQSPNLPVTVNAESRAQACAAVAELEAARRPKTEPAKPEPKPAPERPERPREPAQPKAKSRPKEPARVAEPISEGPWSGDPARFTDAEYRRSCVLDRGGDAPVKERFGLPIREPDGTLNRRAVHAAAAMIGKVTGASAEAIRAAARALVTAYRQLDETPPDNLVKLAALAVAARTTTEQRFEPEEDWLVEQRSAPDTLTVEGRKLRGRIPYGVESRDLGGWTEVMRPGCLRTADLSDLIATVDHQGLPLGRYPGTLSLEHRDDGVHWAVDLPESRAAEREAVERGDLRASSWRMVVARDRWEGNRRYVEEVRALRDVAVVTTSAYPAGAAFAELRTAPIHVRQHEEGRVEDEEFEEQEEETREGGGTLTVEQRSASPDAGGPVEERILDSIRGVPRGEKRSLTEADNSAGPVAPEELSSYLWDRLRDNAVVLGSGVRVITTSNKAIRWPRLTADTAPDFYDELETIDETDPEFDTYDVDVGQGIKARVVASSEVVDDSDPDLLALLRSNLNTTTALRLDLALLRGGKLRGGDTWPGLLTAAGVQVIDAGGELPNYDVFVRAIGAIRGAHAQGPVAIVGHPFTDTALSLLKQAMTGETLARPEGVPAMTTTTQVGRADDLASAVVYAARQVVVIRRMEVRVEVDRSAEWDRDAVSIRSKVRARLFLPYPEAVVRIDNLPAPDPTESGEPVTATRTATRKR
jgi:HK97 family phage major capsid protein